ncbi:single-stranded DNA-binding protein [Leptospira andrefontaineae]|uniref:Single-stranded DNA-binding protein n=1 Tax=Leptospira andrefontaineae TaxID=2484976 RepID=A0A4R9GWU8_9LEPT|nr:single-stranded DNA-binding protein [Leptospira andrefontaineae]TGK36249.1 single-stranded DNA-binding protein [Leptospira andrefontaineae]
MNFSLVFVDGNLTADPTGKQVMGKQVTSFNIAVNYAENKVSYFEVEAWDKVGESCLNHLEKGSRVTIVGDLRQDRWKDGEGRNQSKIKIVAQKVRFDSKKESNQGGGF